jgi:hypothetical protein
VPLPSASESEQQTIFERQSKAQPVSDKEEKEVAAETADAQSVHSESDNEGVDDDDAADSVIEQIDVKANLDAAFDKIVPAKVESGLLETDIDAIVEKAVEIVSERLDDAAEKANIAQEVIKQESTEQHEQEQPAEQQKPADDSMTKEIIAQYSGEAEAEAAAGGDKPPVPIQTYLWEDIKRAKEQVSGSNVCK